jgi:hypothetical protein
MHPSWNSSASPSWDRDANCRLTIPTSLKLARMNRCRASAPCSSRSRNSSSVASAKPAPEVRASRASRPASIARCSSTPSPCASSGSLVASSKTPVTLDTLRQAVPVATASYTKSVDNPARRDAATRDHQVSPRRQCCGYAKLCDAPPAPPAPKTSGCTCAAPQRDSYVAAWTSALRSYA